ncbi:MAG TPA: hypothetical protein PLO23_12085 [Alphaproteobacteria bacterium]|nr:hypothetical protein [Alphaproteobacteria bacterium]
MMSYPAAVFFDWDGTLVDSYGVLEAAHNHTRKALGFDPLPEGAFASYFGKPRDLRTAHHGDRSFFGATGAWRTSVSRLSEDSGRT